MNLHFLFLMSALLVGEAQSTSFYIRPMPEFIRDASHIVRGRIHQPHAEFGVTLNGERNVHTYAELEVFEVFKGSISSPSIQIRKLGGTKDGITLHIPGSPEFQEGEETVLFLGAEFEDHSYEVIGLELGKFSLIEKNGESELKGGLLEYSNGPEANEAMGPGIVENRRAWTIRQLKDLIESQKKENPQGDREQSPSAPAPSLKSADGLSKPFVTDARSTSALKSESPDVLQLAPKNAESAKIAGILFVLAGGLLGIFLYLRRK